MDPLTQQSIMAGGAQAWTPIQSREVLWGEQFDRSPCIGCEHADEDKNWCRAQPDCRMRIATILPRYDITDEDKARIYGMRSTHQCAFTGCTNRTCKTYCSNHSQTVSIRKQEFVRRTGKKPPAEYLHLPMEYKTRTTDLIAEYRRRYGVEP